MPARYDPHLTKSFSSTRGKPKSTAKGTAGTPPPPVGGRAEGAAMNHPVVLITGALTGIGRAAAFAFAKDGGRVVVSGRHEEAGQGLAPELRSLGTEGE